MNMKSFKKLNYKKLVSNFVLHFILLSIVVGILQMILGSTTTVFGILIRTAFTIYFTIYKPLLFRGEKNVYE